jgi:glycerol-3-phosphate dehydrogenase (NAD(P)+)
MNIAFIGFGNFGKAIASLLEYNGAAYDYAETTEGRLLSKKADIVFLTVPAKFMRQALVVNKRYVPDEAIIVNCSKGVEEDSRLLVHQIVQHKDRYPRYYSLIGPSFAEGLIRHEPTAVSLGYQNDTYLPTICKLVETPYFSIHPYEGYQSLELASVLKNVYAILCGYAHGLGFGPNTRARIISLALDEFQRLASAMHYSYDATAPGVAGDLMLTCSSELSRNFQYGLALSTGSHADPGEATIEGYHASHAINTIAKEHGAVLPLAEITNRIIAGGVDTPDAFQAHLANITSR